MSTQPTGRFAFPDAAWAPEHNAGWGLAWYLVWRLLGGALLIFLVLTAIFGAMQVYPGDVPYLLAPHCSPACQSAYFRLWGLDMPIPDRYAKFLTDVFTGNLGVSNRGVPVWNLIGSAVPSTLGVVVVSLLVLGLLSLPIGMQLARRKGGTLDTLASILLALPFSASSVFLGILAVYGLIFAVPLFPPLFGGAGQGYPVTTLVLFGLVVVGSTLALFVWIARDYPLRPPGYPEWGRPTDGPRSNSGLGARILQAIARFLAALPILFMWTLGATLLIEPILNFNGVGFLLVNGLLRLDGFVFQGVVVVLALVAVPVVVAADVAHYAATRRWSRADGLRVENFRFRGTDAWRGIRKLLANRVAMAGLVLLAVLIGMTLAAPILVGPYPTSFNGSVRNLPPSFQHPFGTDTIGNDVLAQTVYGGQPGITVGILGFIMALAAELTVTLAIGFFGSRATVFVAIPVDLFLVLGTPFAVLIAIAPSTYLVAPALLGWPIATRLLLLETTGLVSGSRDTMGRPLPLNQRGSRALKLVWGTAPLIVGDALLAVSLALIAWTGFAFYGFRTLPVAGVRSWGGMVFNAVNGSALLVGTWWTFVPPIVCTILAVLAPALMALGIKRMRVPVGREMPGGMPVPGPAVAPPNPPV